MVNIEQILAAIALQTEANSLAIGNMRAEIQASIQEDVVDLFGDLATDLSNLHESVSLHVAQSKIEEFNFNLRLRNAEARLQEFQVHMQSLQAENNRLLTVLEALLSQQRQQPSGN